MNKTTIQILFFTFLTFSWVYSQDYNRSVLIEVPIIKTELYSQKYLGLQKINEYYEARSSSGINISYSWRFPLLLDTKLEIRPGIFVSDPDLMGIDFGFYLRRNIYKNLFAVVGSNVHYNFGFSEGNMTSSSHSLGGFYISPGGSIGFSLSQKISVFIGYYVSLKNNWRDSWSSSFHDPYYSKSSEKIFWMFKMGVELNH
jgi:hypothetical protein